MIKVDTEQLKQYESDLKTFKESAYPFATKQMVNKAAFQARDRVLFAMKKKQTLRRPNFAKKSVQVVQTRTLRVSHQEARMGGVPSYMEDQEFGTTKVKSGKVGVSIPTSMASGEGRGARPRRKIPTGQKRLSKIQLKHNRSEAAKRKQENLIKIKEAAASSSKFVFLDLQKHPGIYKITGGKKKPKINLFYDMSKGSVRIPRLPIFAPATLDTQKQMPFIYKKALIFQLKKWGLFKG